MRDDFSLYKYVTYVSVEFCGTDLKNSFKIVNSLNLKMVLKLHCPQKKLHKQSAEIANFITKQQKCTCESKLQTGIMYEQITSVCLRYKFFINPSSCESFKLTYYLNI